jgi:hypothetical protein
VVSLNGDLIQLSGPCGPEAWYLEVGADEDPVAAVTRLTRGAVGEPLLVHSTSWRRDRDSVVLSFVVVMPHETVSALAAVSVRRADLARSTATEAPRSIGQHQVLEHGLRHLAWLARDDPEVSHVLSDSWRTALAGYVPEPFRHLS